MYDLIRHQNVPAGSRWEVSVVAPAGMAVTGVMSTYGAGPVPNQNWTAAQLSPGPIVTQVTATVSAFVADVDLLFGTPANVVAVVTSVVRKPNGTVHGSPRSLRVTGKAGSGPSTITIWVRK